MKIKTFMCLCSDAMSVQVSIYDGDLEDAVYEGSGDCIPADLQERKIESWDLGRYSLVINV